MRKSGPTLFGAGRACFLLVLLVGGCANYRTPGNEKAAPIAQALQVQQRYVGGLLKFVTCSDDCEPVPKKILDTGEVRKQANFMPAGSGDSSTKAVALPVGLAKVSVTTTITPAPGVPAAQASRVSGPGKSTQKHVRQGLGWYVVYFEGLSDSLSPRAKAVIAEAVQDNHDYSQVVLLGGSSGSSAKNKVLIRDRTRAVKRTLMGLGVDKHRLLVRSAAHTDPTPNLGASLGLKLRGMKRRAGPEGMRRVELLFLKRV